jgi:hypothetical protein
MSLKEVQDTVTFRFRQKNQEIYTLSGMIRVAVLSVFSKETKFPDPPYNEQDEEGNWKNSYNYLKALQENQRRRC